MTLSAVEPQYTPNRGPRTAAAIAIGITGIVVAVVLALVSVTFFGLAIGFTIALPVASAAHVAVSAADAAIATTFAPFWWVFGIFSIVSLVASGVVFVKTLTFLSPVARD
jgi:hypothetical protein